MAFQRPKKQPNFADLKAVLSQTQHDNATYQLLEALIERLVQFQSLIINQIDEVVKSVDEGKGLTGEKGPVGPPGPVNPIVSPHAPTHGYGGSDPLLHVNSEFSVRGANSVLNFLADNSPTNMKRWRLINYGDNYFRFEALNDANSVIMSTPFVIDHNTGNVQLGGTLVVPVGYIQTAGSISAATAYLASGNPSLYLRDTGQPPNTSQWRLMSQSRNLIVFAQNDDESGYVIVAQFNRADNSFHSSGRIIADLGLQPGNGQYYDSVGGNGITIIPAVTNFFSNQFDFINKGNTAYAMRLTGTGLLSVTGAISTQGAVTSASVSTGSVNASAASNFTGLVTINSTDALYLQNNGYVRASFRDLSQPTGAKTFVLLNYNQNLFITPTDDTGAQPLGGDWARALSIDRNGAVISGTGGFSANRIINGSGLGHGTYTPIDAGAGGNILSNTFYPASWMRVGNTFNMSGQIDINPAAAGPAHARMYLPSYGIYSLLSSKGIGTLTSTVESETGYLVASPNAPHADIIFVSKGAGNRGFFYTITWTV